MLNCFQINKFHLATPYSIIDCYGNGYGAYYLSLQSWRLVQLKASDAVSFFSVWFEVCFSLPAAIETKK